MTETTTKTIRQQTDYENDCTSAFSSAITTSETTSTPVVSAQVDHLLGDELFISEEPREKTETRSLCFYKWPRRQKEDQMFGCLPHCPMS